MRLFDRVHILNMVQVLVEGKQRAELVRFDSEDVYLEAEVALFEEEEISLDENVKEAMLRGIKELFVRYCNENTKMSKDLAGQILEIEEIEKEKKKKCRKK